MAELARHRDSNAVEVVPFADGIRRLTVTWGGPIRDRCALEEEEEEEL